jgi:hypothetical protein
MTREHGQEHFVKLDDLVAAVNGVDLLGLRPEGVTLPSLARVLKADRRSNTKVEAEPKQPAITVDAWTGKRTK